MTPQRKQIQVAGRRISFLSAGKNRDPLVLLHGGGVDCAALSWKHAIGPLSDHHRCLAVDLPGFGESAPPPDNALIDQAYFLRFLPAFLDALGLEQISLMGLSLGGGIALGFALQFPFRVNKLVLVDSYGLHSRAPLHHLSCFLVHLPLFVECLWWFFRHRRQLLPLVLRHTIYEPGNASEELVEDVLRLVRKKGRSPTFQAWERSEVRWAGLRTCYQDRLHEITTPTLIVHGDRDRLVPVSAARIAHDRIRESRLHLFAACGHWPPRERPAEFNRVVSDFLSEKWASPGPGALNLCIDRSAEGE